MKSIAIVGFGNVGEYAARLYTELGGKIITISSYDQEDKKAHIFLMKLHGLDLRHIFLQKCSILI